MTPETRTFADRGAPARRACPKCGNPKAVEVVVQARPFPIRTGGTLANRSRSMCEPCALRTFEQIEAVLDAGVGEEGGNA